MADVFVSYSRRDTDFVKRLVNRFTQQGREVWVDWEDIPRAADWLQEIYAGIEAANTFVFVVSSHSLSSEVCNHELGRALAQSKRIVPLIREHIQGDVETQVRNTWIGKEWQSTAENNWTAIRHLNWLFFNNDDEDKYNQEYGALIETLDADLDYIKLHTRLLVRARVWETNGSNPSYLLTGDEIVEAETWLQAAHSGTKSPDATQLHMDYIATSRHVEDERLANLRRLESRTRQFQRASVVLGMLIFGAVAAVLLAVNRANDAQAQADAAHQVIATSTSVIGTQVADVQIAQQQVADANATLTPIPPTLTQAADTVAEAVAQVTVARGQLDVAEAELTAVPPTMEAIATQVRRGEQRVEALQLAAQALDLAAASSQKLDESDGEMAALLALQSLRIDFTQQADTALVNANASLFTRQMLEDHEGGITSVDVSADGRFLLSSSSDMTVDVWDMRAGTVVTRFEEHEAEVQKAEFLPDSQRAISGDADGVIYVWNILTGEIQLAFDAHENSIEALALSPTDPWVVSSDLDGTIMLWNYDTGAVEEDLTDWAEGDVPGSLAFSPSGDLLAISFYEEVFILNLFDDSEPVYLEGHRFDVVDIVFSPDDETVITGSEDMSVRIWDVETEEELWQIPASSIITSVDVSPDGRYIVASNEQNSVQVFDASTGQEVRRLSGHLAKINDAVFSPDGQFIVTGSDDATVRVWKAQIGVLDGQFRGHEDWVISVAITTDQSTVVSISDDSTLRVWDAANFTQISSFSMDDRLYRYLVMLPDNQRVMLAGDTGAADMVNLATGEIERSFKGHNGQPLNKVRLSPDSSLLLSAGEDGTAELWSIETGELLKTYDHGELLIDALFSPTEPVIVTAADSGSIVLWDMETAAEITRYTAAEMSLGAISYTPDGTRLIYGTTGGAVQIIDARTGEGKSTLEGPSTQILAVNITPDGRFALAAGDDNNVFIWDMETGELVRRLTGHSNWINDVKLTADGRKVLTASADRSVRLELLDLNELITYVCGHLFTDLDETDRARYGITSADPTCE